MRAKAHLCMQSRTECIRIGHRETLPSQLSTVQKDYHGPTSWSFSWVLLWVIFKTASLFKKNPKTALNLYIHVVTIHLHQSSELGVCSTPRCMANLSASLLAMQWCEWGESIGCWAWECQQEQKHWPRPQIILSISTLRSKAKVKTTSCDTCDLPQPCVKTSCTEAFNVTA